VQASELVALSTPRHTRFLSVIGDSPYRLGLMMMVRMCRMGFGKIDSSNMAR